VRVSGGGGGGGREEGGRNALKLKAERPKQMFNIRVRLTRAGKENKERNREYQEHRVARLSLLLFFLNDSIDLFVGSLVRVNVQRSDLAGRIHQHANCFVMLCQLLFLRCLPGDLAEQPRINTRYL